MFMYAQWQIGLDAPFNSNKVKYLCDASDDCTLHAVSYRYSGYAAYNVSMPIDLSHSRV